MIIAIDGPAGSGKSTTARLVAQRLDYLYLDTGAMYRAVGLGVLQRGGVEKFDPESIMDAIDVDVLYADGRMQVLLNGEDVSAAIRSAEVGAAASHVSTHVSVREMMVARQRRIAREAVEQGRGVVMDGRDIGTDVFPDADLKIFMDAEPGVRARRRYEELRAAGSEVEYQDILQEINKRDQSDMSRAASPLRKAEDAIVIDTSNMSIDDQVAYVLGKVRERGRTPAG